MSDALHKTVGTDITTVFSPEELARRRQASRRLAWVLGAIALAFYLIGFLLKR